MESPITKSLFDDIAFSKIVKSAKEAQLKDTISRIGEYEGIHQDQILKMVLKNTSKLRVQNKFKALKNAAKGL